MKGFFTSLLITISISLYAARVDTATIFSNAMHRPYKAVVIVPDAAVNKSKLFPSVYLLHGYSGYFSNWIQRVPQLATYADTYQLIIICPEGGFSSWYFDSPVDSSMRFETYISKEVPAYIDDHYPTFKNRNARAITGLSMGGHGGLFLGFRHADFFGACGSMSGALLIDRITNGYGVEKILGDTIKNRHYYRELSIMNEMEHYKPSKDSLAIIMDCGTED
ncbi:MAG: alpha/beta hydrolase, partial [Flavisolibacter sp.]